MDKIFLILGVHAPGILCRLQRETVVMLDCIKFLKFFIINEVQFHVIRSAEHFHYTGLAFQCETLTVPKLCLKNVRRVTMSWCAQICFFYGTHLISTGATHDSETSKKIVVS